MTHDPPHPWNRHDLDADLVRALERERLQRHREPLRFGLGACATTEEERAAARAAIRQHLGAAPKVERIPAPHPAKVAVASLATLLLIGAVCGLVAAGATATYCALAGCP